MKQHVENLLHYGYNDNGLWTVSVGNEVLLETDDHEEYLTYLLIEFGLDAA